MTIPMVESQLEMGDDPVLGMRLFDSAGELQNLVALSATHGRSRCLAWELHYVVALSATHWRSRCLAWELQYVA